MSILKASPSDFIEVVYLLKTCIREMHSKGWLYWDTNNLLVNNNIETNTIFIYRNEEVCRGLIMFRDGVDSSRSEKTKKLYIHSLIVHPSWRNQGIGRQLLLFAEEYAKENGYESINLFVFSGNENAVALYQNMDYQVSTEILSHYPQKPFIHFEKRLNTL